jgi:hypothetical protein
MSVSSSGYFTVAGMLRSFELTYQDLLAEFELRKSKGENMDERAKDKLVRSPRENGGV